MTVIGREKKSWSEVVEKKFVGLDNYGRKMAQIVGMEKVNTQGEVTSQSLWSRYYHHFVGITRYNALC